MQRTSAASCSGEIRCHRWTLSSSGHWCVFRLAASIRGARGATQQSFERLSAVVPTRTQRGR